MTRVIVIDGYDETREAAVAALQVAGFDVAGFEDDDDARASIETRASDLVVLDLPSAELAESAAALRRAGGERVVILALVEATDARARAAAKGAGVDFVVLRPCAPEALVRHVSRFAKPARR